MGRHTPLLVPAVLIALVTVILLTGCEKLDPGPLSGNQPPDTRLSIEADRGDTTSLRVAFAWSGEDPDGSVVRFWTRLDSLEWVRTARPDTVLVLSLDDAVLEDGSPAPHVFAVRAEDNEGEFDPTPAAIEFTARNTLPETEIISGPAGVACPIVRFEWRGWDYDGVVVGYGWALHWWDSAYSEWVWVAGDDDVPPDEFALTIGPIAGLHRFEVWSIDDAGESDGTPAFREFSSNPVLDGPKLYVHTNFVGTLVFRGHDWATPPADSFDIFEGEHLTFNWIATSEDCGGDVLGYSYAYDDTTDWGLSYSLDDVHFEVTPEPGEHTFYLSAIDDLGMITRGRVCVNVAQMTREYVLLVDGWDYHESIAPWGTDEQRDTFYDTLTMACSRPVVTWDMAEHVVGGSPRPPDVSTMAGASTVLWFYDQDCEELDLTFDPYQAEYLSLAGYVRAGGNLVLAGWKGLSQMAGGASYPMEFTAGDTARERVFIRDQLGIRFADNSGSAANKDSPWSYGYCFYGAVPGETSVPGGDRGDLTPVYIDSVGPGGYPEAGKWPVYTWQSPPYPEGYVRAGPAYVEKLDAYGGEPIEASVIDAYLNMNYEGEPCVVLRYTGTDRGNTCYFGFPLYYTQTDQAVALFDRIWEMFGE
jgi:hypothetical protein